MKTLEYKALLPSLMLYLICCNLLTGQDLNEDLQAHYSFNGSLVDSADGNFHLELLDGNIEFNTEENGNQYISLDLGAQLRSEIPFSTNGWREISVSLWFRSTHQSPERQVLIQGAFTGFAFLVRPTNGQVFAFFDGGSPNSIQGTEDLMDGNWHHVLAQSDGAATFLYVDGDFQGSRNENLFTGNGDANNRLFFGQTNLSQLDYEGSLDEVRIYNRTLSPEEIDILSGSRSPKPNGTTSTDTPSLRPTINIYPNPTTNYINWLPEVPKSYTLFNSNGQKVRVGEGTRIDVIGLPLGMYYLKLEGEKLRKVVIQHRGVYP